MLNQLLRSRYIAAVIVAFLSGAPAVGEQAGSSKPAALILFAGNQHIQIGPYSAFARFQGKFSDALKACKLDATAQQLSREPAGMWSAITSIAIRNASRCKSLKSAPKNGALTTALWSEVMGGEATPSLKEKFAALTLTFEATGFDQKPEWNFCQDSPNPLAVAGAITATAAKCYNQSDPCSFVTWGPRGATAGQGREIQWVLANVIRRTPGLVEYAFGAERENAQRFVGLLGPPPESCDGSTPLEHFMCAVWIDPDRRRMWEKALQSLGKQQSVRSVFDDVYARQEFDGYKLDAYFALWETLGVAPSEIDFAFFHDRSTQIGGPPEVIAGDLKKCLDGEPAQVTRNAAARRCLARLHPHPTQPDDRYARDAAYYIDSYTPQRLTKAELRMWQRHIPLAAGAQFGLSDDARVRREDLVSDKTLDIEVPDFVGTLLTDAEKSCPASILRPIRSRP